jgi:hypothetical protein
MPFPGGAEFDHTVFAIVTAALGFMISQRQDGIDPPGPGGIAACERLHADRSDFEFLIMIGFQDHAEIVRRLRMLNFAEVRLAIANDSPDQAVREAARDWGGGYRPATCGRSGNRPSTSLPYVSEVART